MGVKGCGKGVARVWQGCERVWQGCGKGVRTNIIRVHNVVPWVCYMYYDVTNPGAMTSLP